MGRIPRSPQSHKDDTVGVGADPNCPDRSWCVAELPGTRESGDTGRQASPDGPWQETPPSGGEGKSAQPEKDTFREKKLQWSGSHEEGERKFVGRTAVARGSAPSLRSARRASQPKNLADLIAPLTTLIGALQRMVRLMCHLNT